ncbi:amidophosphoribosyltransferase [Synechococcus sp. BL107]|nr:amidophosphoribosyltransferase [Synechococcus sp. BL107]
MRWNARGHADGDARTTIEEKEWELRGENRWFLLRPIKVRRKVDGVITDFLKKSLMGNRG